MMLWFYAQQTVFIVVDACLFTMVVLRLLTPPARTGAEERRTRMTLGFLSVAFACLGLLHAGDFVAYFAAARWGGRAWEVIAWVSAIFDAVLYLGFGALMAAAIAQLMRTVPPERAASLERTAPSGSSVGSIESTHQRTDWGYLWKQLRIVFFRIGGMALLLGAAPLAFYQRNFGVGIMALATGLGCLWLGFHRHSPLAIKYASLAEEESD